MSKVQELLLQQRREVNEAMKALKADLKEIETALSAIDTSKKPTAAKRKRGQVQSKMTVNSAIIEAIKNRCGTPAEIERFMLNELGLETTKASISTRLSKLKAADEIEHDQKARWVIVKNETPTGEPGGVSEFTGEVAASPYEGQTGFFTRHG